MQYSKGVFDLSKFSKLKVSLVFRINYDPSLRIMNLKVLINYYITSCSIDKADKLFLDNEMIAQMANLLARFFVPFLLRRQLIVVRLQPISVDVANSVAFST